MTSKLNFPMSDIVVLVMLLILAAYAIYTGILYYHWQQYSSSKRVSFLTMLIYAIVTVPLAGVILLTGLLF